jgi:hypothetical protein
VRPGTEQAKVNLLRAALRCLSTDLNGEHPNAANEAEYADEMLAAAARDLVAVVDALPQDQKPVGWSQISVSSHTLVPLGNLGDDDEDA